MNNSPLLASLNLGVRATIVIMVLIETVNFSIGLAFATGAIQARGGSSLRRAPIPISFEERIDLAQLSR